MVYGMCSIFSKVIKYFALKMCVFCIKFIFAYPRNPSPKIAIKFLGSRLSKYASLQMFVNFDVDINFVIKICVLYIVKVYITVCTIYVIYYTNTIFFIFLFFPPPPILLFLCCIINTRFYT